MRRHVGRQQSAFVHGAAVVGDVLIRRRIKLDHHGAVHFRPGHVHGCGVDIA